MLKLKNYPKKSFIISFFPPFSYFISWANDHEVEFHEIKICLFHEIKITIMRSKFALFMR